MTASLVSAADPDLSCTTGLSNEGSITVNYDPDTELVNMAAILKTGTFAGWGWGSSMIDTEMVIFSADGNASSVGTYYSSGKTTPLADDTLASCYTTGFTVNEDTSVTFQVTRPLNCEIDNSYVV